MSILKKNIIPTKVFKEEVKKEKEEVKKEKEKKKLEEKLKQEFILRIQHELRWASYGNN